MTDEMVMAGAAAAALVRLLGLALGVVEVAREGEGLEEADGEELRTGAVEAGVASSVAVVSGLGLLADGGVGVVVEAMGVEAMGVEAVGDGTGVGLGLGVGFAWASGGAVRERANASVAAAGARTGRRMRELLSE
ncbi:MAG: hypothetical protein WAV52_08825 [Luteococcus japonicus]